MQQAAAIDLLVMGAGSVGCYVGGRLAAAGQGVQFVGRPRVLDALARHGLTVSDLAGYRAHLPPEQLRCTPAVPAGLRPSLVLLCVKSGATAEAAAELAAQLPAGTPVLSLQNGVANAEVAQAAAPRLRLVPGMVAFNVAELGPGRYHRGTAGRLAARHDATLAGWQPHFEAAGLPLDLHADLAPYQWGKLLLNLNNAVNAVSGLPLRQELLDRGLRRCLATLIDEALAVMRRAGIAPVLDALPAHRLPALLRLPTPLFRLLAARMLRIDAQARSSMADDLRLGRPTEIDALCGAVVRLAAAHGMAAPRNARMLAIVHGPGPGERWSGPRLLQALQALQATGT